MVLKRCQSTYSEVLNLMLETESQFLYRIFIQNCDFYLELQFHEIRFSFLLTLPYG
jgi:hypothetical protein